jgi:hypothetical protein
MTAESHSANRGSIPRGSNTLLTAFFALTCALFQIFSAGAATTEPASPDDRFSIGQLLHRDDFDHGLENWTTELESGGSVGVKDGRLEIDVPAGCTIWFKLRLDGPVMIAYDATVVSAGGPNDRVSDLNCFWMARDARSPDDLFARKRSGRFADYNPLLTYYVGQGGNGNTTTRFRRYVGDQVNRPLLPEHDKRDPADLLTANVKQTIQLIACGSIVQYYRDGKRVFELNDPHPYTSGWFALRTTKNHMTIERFCVYRLELPPTTQQAR